MIDYSSFIRAKTKAITNDFLPELTLHLADKMEPLWKEIELFIGDPDCEPPFWAFAWAGGLGLARHILDHPELVAGKRVLDFASGSGLVGLAASKAGAKKVRCCDIDPFAQAALKLNAALNQTSVELMEISYLKRPVKGVDVILAGDVCYDHLMAHRVISWLRLCASAGAQVVLGDPGRAYAPRDGVEPLAELIVPTLLALEDEPQRKVKILSLTG